MSKKNKIWVAHVRMIKDKNGKDIPVYKVKYEKPKVSGISEVKRMTM